MASSYWLLAVLWLGTDGGLFQRGLGGILPEIMCLAPAHLIGGRAASSNVAVPVAMMKRKTWGFRCAGLLGSVHGAITAGGGGQAAKWVFLPGAAKTMVMVVGAVRVPGMVTQ
mmetsp:Transcript_25901/g.65917  ORF Transcript_25901/g.65917 Transcript_25901/m.65917 type:complete len:113 (-) Transcript_25901:426-764(-)